MITICNVYLNSISIESNEEEYPIYFLVNESTTTEIPSPENYTGKILFSMFPHIDIDNPSSTDSFQDGSTYTLRVYRANTNGQNVLIGEKSYLGERSFDIEILNLSDLASGVFTLTFSSDMNSGLEYENISFYSSAHLTTIDDSNGRVDVGKVLGETPISADTIAEKILENPENLLQTDALGRVNINPTNLATSILEYVANPSSSSLTVEEILKILLSWSVGTWRLKNGEDNIYEILDPDDNDTVIIEVNLDSDSPYKQVELKI